MSATIRTTSAFMVLSTVVLSVVAYPFTSLFNATYANTVSMGNVLIGFLVGLVPFSVLFVLQRVYYSLSDTKTPFFLQVLQATLFTGLALLCALLPVEWIAVGLALSLSFATAVQTVVAAILIRRKLGGHGGRGIAVSFVRFVVGVIPAGVIGVLVLLALQLVFGLDFTTSGFVTPVLTMLIVGAVMLAVYVGTLLLLRSPEVHEARRLVLSRVRRG